MYLGKREEIHCKVDLHFFEVHRSLWTTHQHRSDHRPPFQTVIATNCLQSLVWLSSGSRTRLALRFGGHFDDESNWVRVFLSVLWCSGAVFMAYAHIHIVILFQFGSKCLAEHTPPIMRPMFALVISIQLIIWGMTIWKRWSSWNLANPLMKLLTRDGAIVWISCTAYCAILIQNFSRLHLLIHSSISCYSVVLSIMTSRIILNTLRLEPDNRRSSEVELTTCMYSDDVMRGIQSATSGNDG